jgi:putative ABC transport system permease protein
MSSLLGHVRYGIRTLVRRPSLSVTAVIALALGIGLTTTMFSIVYGAVIRGLPYDDSDRLVALFRNRPAQGVQFMGVSIHDFEDWRTQQTSFEDIAAYYAETVNIGGTEGEPIRYLGAYASARMFEILRVQPVLGRVFRPEEDHPSTPPVMLLSYRAWQDRFHGDPAIVGRTVRANAEMTTIVGVMPERFGFPAQMYAWLPLRIDRLAFTRGGGPAVEGTQLQAVARLKPGVSVEAAQAEMATIATGLSTTYPESNQGIGVTVLPLMDTFVGPEPRAMLFTMLGAVFGVLLIACANVANLLLARTAARSKEIAIRTALGASRTRTIVQLLAETLVLAACGAAAGLLIATVGIDFFNDGLALQDTPLWLEASLDPAVMVFVVGVTGLATLMAGTIPALRATKADVAAVMNDEARGSSSGRMGRITRSLVIAQLAVSCGLLVAAGLMIRTVINVARFDYGFATDDIFTARLGLFEKDYPTAAAQSQFYDALLRGLDGRPGIRAAAFVSDLPARGGQMQPVTLDGVAYPTEQDHPLARRIVITPRYFDIVEVTPVRGRTFEPTDGPGTQPVAIVNARFVELHFKDRDPLGARIKLGPADAPWRTIVGVVPNLYLGGAIGALDPRHEGVYVPLAQNVINFMSLVVRTEQAAMSYTATIQDEVHRLDRALPLYWVRSLAEQYAMDTWFYRVFGTLFVAFGLAALAMATIGLYGVMSFSAGTRTREIGVRMALGAERKTVLMMILGQGVWQIAAGLAIGLVLAALLSRGLGLLLFGVRPWDPAVFAVVVLALTAAGTLAAFIPARRATRIAPVEALRLD